MMRVKEGKRNVGSPNKLRKVNNMERKSSELFLRFYQDGSKEDFYMI